MYKLVIAEKPSVAKSIAAVLGATKREDGYFDGNGYLVSWCLGHLAEFASADAYDEKYGKWRVSDLPILPENWQYAVSRDKAGQLALLKKLMNRDDVAEVINACDAGREGESIFRTVYNLVGCHKPMKRLWISSMEDSAIIDGFNNLRDGKEYDNLYASAVCRSKADWLVGINATRLFSVLYHRTLNVGRVVSPTLAMIVQRESEISAFEPVPFYTVSAEFENFTAVSEKYSDKAEAEKVRENCTGQQTVVKSVEHKEHAEKAPMLYDLTTLQRDANRLLGYTAQQTLDYLQSMYEKKLCTYPRTDSRYLTDDMEDGVKALVLCCGGICELDVPSVFLSGQVCDSSKVSDHHAIIPTLVAGSTSLDSLPAGEREILLLLARQVLMAVCEPYRYEETVVTMDCGATPLTAKGKQVLNLGWKTYAKQDTEDKPLPFLKEWDILTSAGAEIKEGKTKPPKHYTEDTLLSAMETAGAKEMPDDAERKGLGTPATRAAILEKLIATGFVERRKSKKVVNLVPTQVGNSLITVLPEQLQSPLLTAEWENRLKQIEHGDGSPDEFLKDISELVTELTRTYEPVKGSEVLFPSGREELGKCPRCGGSVTESKLGFFCERNDCKFGLWRDNKFLNAKKINLTKKMVTSLLKDGKAFVSGIYSEKTGKNYDAFICLEDDGAHSVYHIEFDKEKK